MTFASKIHKQDQTGALQIHSTHLNSSNCIVIWKFHQISMFDPLNLLCCHYNAATINKQKFGSPFHHLASNLT